MPVTCSQSILPHSRRRRSLALLLFLFWAPALWAQSTQGLIAGRVFDSVTGRPVANGLVTCFTEALNSTISTRTDNFGYYYLPQLSPGFYNVRVEAGSYQAREAVGVELQVA